MKLVCAEQHAMRCITHSVKCRRDKATIAASRTGTVAAGMMSGRQMIDTSSVAREAPPIGPGTIDGTTTDTSPRGDGSRPAIPTTGARTTEAIRHPGRNTRAAAPAGPSMAARIRRQLTQHPAATATSRMRGMQGTARPAQHAIRARRTETITTAETATLGETATGTARAAGATRAQRRSEQTAADVARGTTLLPRPQSSQSQRRCPQKRRLS